MVKTYSLLIPNNSTFQIELGNAISMQEEIVKSVKELIKIDKTYKHKQVWQTNPLLNSSIEKQTALYEKQICYILGILAANYDTMPSGLAEKQRINGMPLDILIKLTVNKYVADRRKQHIPEEMLFNNSDDYFGKYIKLLDLICGGTTSILNLKKFREFFPCGIHENVRCFAEGYCVGFHVIAATSGVTTEETIPLTQDIWKNWTFFLSPNTFSYRLDGDYIFYKNSKPVTRTVNEGVYEALKNRSAMDFSEKQLDLSFF